jgi:hypothetical protein
MVCHNVNINGQNNRYWYSENHHEFCETPLPDPVRVLCAVSARKIIGVMFSEETVNSCYCLELIPTPFLRELTAKGTVELLHAGRCHVQYSRLVGDCPISIIYQVAGNLQITAL